MHVNHAETIARINHIIIAQNDNHHHYARFYREMCDFLDYHYGNDGQGWYKSIRPIFNVRGRRWSDAWWSVVMLFCFVSFESHVLLCMFLSHAFSLHALSSLIDWFCCWLCIDNITNLFELMTMVVICLLVWMINV